MTIFLFILLVVAVVFLAGVISSANRNQWWKAAEKNLRAIREGEAKRREGK